ncbi:AAA family ATPase [Mycobacteroides abscessus]|uniref:AAA family ATPase n=1 Tax=Mycobacteroides abscessus TaxID=36809 RepID=UPI000C26A6DD|nr:ATP-binding protein [Mycobacteroides abscessus]
MDERVIDRQCVAIADRLLACAHTGSRPHHLLVGPSGTGKSAALDVIVNKIAAAVGPDELLIVKTASDGYGISSYRDFLAEIAWAIGYGALERGGAVRELEDRIQAAAAGRAVLFVIDNIDYVFDKIVGTTQFGGSGGQGAFQGWIENLGAGHGSGYSQHCQQ